MDQNKGFSQPTSDAKKDHCSEIQHKEDQNPTSNTSKPSGKNAKQGTHASDSLKEEYIHVRARRGQATNSHSLAERVSSFICYGSKRSNICLSFDWN